ncbi:MAG: hypothetical protein HWE11_00115 [Gammaproteobacteria bacterium]|nr:hypothetical protein [Gammaproteobacteria bacterium]
MKPLSQKVAQTLIKKIKQAEQSAAENDSFVYCDDYLALARLYNSLDNYQKEIAVLTRFIDLGRAANEDLPIVERQLSEAKAALHEQRQIQKISGTNPIAATQDKSREKPSEPSKVPPLQLENETAADAPIWPSNREQPASLSARDIINVHEQPLDTIKLVSMCAAYTGKSEEDEIFELAIISFEYCQNNDTVTRILDEYHGTRQTAKTIPPEAIARLNTHNRGKSPKYLDVNKVNKIFEKADAVISHNDPHIERQLFLCLFPHLSAVKWRSSQSDIPWQALGFSEKGLSKLLHRYQFKRPNRTPVERAKAIIRLLSQFEPGTQTSLFKRLLHCQPMKPFEWTKSLKQRADKLQKKRFSFGFKR